jgi:hypothetical protein
VLLLVMGWGDELVPGDLRHKQADPVVMTQVKAARARRSFRLQLPALGLGQPGAGDSRNNHHMGKIWFN